MGKQDYILAMETGIGGGSVSLIADSHVLDFRCGEAYDSKADLLLGSIAEMLLQNGLEKSSIKKIYFSKFPGSSTGLKIGESLAKGLRTAIGSRAVGRNLFEGVRDYFKDGAAAAKLIVLPAGRAGIHWVLFDRTGDQLWDGEIKLNKKNDFKNLRMISDHLKAEGDVRIYTPLETLAGRPVFSDIFAYFENREVVDLGKNLSVYLAGV